MKLQIEIKSTSPKVNFESKALRLNSRRTCLGQSSK